MLLMLQLALVAVAPSSLAQEGHDLDGQPVYPEPTKNQTAQSFIDGLQPHRMVFTGLAYQYFAICGAGSNDPGGSNDCKPADATGAPHLALGHPTQTPPNIGTQLTAGLGAGFQDSPLELWPTISYGNPGNATVLNSLIDDHAAIEQFIADAITIAHQQKLTGFNFDLESTQGGANPKVSVNLPTFLQKFGAALQAADPPVRVGYDAGNTPMAGVEDMDRWISMATYTGNTAAYLAGLANGMQSLGSKFGVGLCPTCGQLSEAATQARFDGIAKYNTTVREIDLCMTFGLRIILCLPSFSGSFIGLDSRSGCRRVEQRCALLT